MSIMRVPLKGKYMKGLIYVLIFLFVPLYILPSIYSIAIHLASAMYQTLCWILGKVGSEKICPFCPREANIIQS